MNTTCTCGQRWAVVPSILKAHPGYRTEPTTVTVRDDWNRQPVQRLTSRWISEGPSVPLVHAETETETTYSWACPCGATPSVTQPRQYLVTCQHGAGESGMCATAAALKPNPYVDYTQNVGACPCCGRQGTHWVTWDQPAPCGASPLRK